MNPSVSLLDDHQLADVRSAGLAHMADHRPVVLGERDVRGWLAPLLPFGAAIDCATAEEARAAADELGGTVVVKGLSPEAVHKSDHGLVRVGCADPAAAEQAAAELLERVAALGIADSSVLSVQTQLSGVEIAIGLRRDTLGTMCMVSAGGTMIELLEDTAVRMAPIDRDEALEMVRSLRCWPLLEGFRGDAGADVDAVVELLCATSQLAQAVPELEELDLNPVFASEQGCRIADARCVLRQVEAPATSGAGGGSDLRALFEPKRIAVVGASQDTAKVGGLIVRYLRKHQWDGDLVVVNNSGNPVDGIKAYTSLRDVPEPVDLACIAVPAAAVEAVIEDCVSAGVPAGIVFSAGFAEAGDAGRARQERLTEAAGGRFRFVGPNTIGVATPHEGLVASFGMALEADIPSGPVAFVSQSGAIASSLISRATEFGIGFSHWISTGNEADLGVADFIDYLVDDDATRVICLFLEAVRDPVAFSAACDRARQAGKPIVALKSGRSEAGQAAAVSHTGALTGSATAYRAFLKACHVIEVESLPGLLIAAQALLSVGRVDGTRIAVVSMSGGACSLLADACADVGLTLPPLPESTAEALRDVLPTFAGVGNPIDITAVGISNPDLVRRTIEALRADDVADLILLQLSTNADPAAERMAHDLLALRDEPGTPFLVGRLGSPRLAPKAMRAYADGGAHVFTWPEQLVEAAKACVQYGATGQEESA